MRTTDVTTDERSVFYILTGLISPSKNTASQGSSCWLSSPLTVAKIIGSALLLRLLLLLGLLLLLLCRRRGRRRGRGRRRPVLRLHPASLLLGPRRQRARFTT